MVIKYLVNWVMGVGPYGLKSKALNFNLKTADRRCMTKYKAQLLKSNTYQGPDIRKSTTFTAFSFAAPYSSV